VRNGGTAPLLAAAVVVGAAVRFPFLGHQSLWIDETYTRDIVLTPHLSSVWSMVKASESTPPLYYWLSWLVSHALGSGSAAVLRLLSAVAGTLAVPVAFVVFRRRLGTTVALAVAWLCAVSPVLVWYSLDARAYALFIFVGLINLGALFAALELPDSRHWVVWALTAVLCIWTHYFGAFFVAGQVLYVLLARPDLRRRVVAWSVPVVLAAAPLLVLISGQTSDARRAFLESRTLRVQVEQTVRQFGMGPNVPSALLEGAGLAVLALALVAGTLMLIRRRDRTGALMGLVIAITVLPPFLLTVTHIDRIYYMRNVLVIWPLVAAIAAFGLVRARGVPLAIYAALSIATVLAIQADWRYQNVDWATVSKQIRARIGSEPALVYQGFAGARVASVYLHRTASPGPVTAQHLAVIVEPARTDKRALEPQPQLPGTPVPQFAERQATALPHGFRLLLYDAPAPQPVGQGGWHPTVFNGPPWFVLGAQAG
jgi:4-amino-4-deoxy-L-arabinose transferase-like glycosyltransferase